MEAVKYIQSEAKTIAPYYENPQLVVDFINRMDSLLITELIELYKDRCVRKSGKRNGELKPVNAVRYEILMRIKNGQKVSIKTINDFILSIKNNNKTIFKYIPDKAKKAIGEYPGKYRKSFEIWKNLAGIFHPFFFCSQKKKKVNKALEDISKYLKATLHLENYKHHCVNFEGSMKRGTSNCWMALYPRDTGGLKKSYQLFLGIYSENFSVGIYTGRDVKVDRNDIKTATNFDEVIDIAKEFCSDLSNFNEGIILKEEKSSKKDIEPEFHEQDDDDDEEYSEESARSKIFMSEEKIDNILEALKIKKNVILQGPPGVGKTFVAQEIAWMFNGVQDRSLVEMIQFHQSYSYEDFIQGIRPKQDGGFEVKDGIFYQFCKKAQKSPGKDFFFIIDEINRGNLSKIFGELMMLIEADKRDEDYAIKLTYSEEKLFIPKNIYIIGTMNTADRSLAMVDYALRRRFAFISLRPEYGSKKFYSHLQENGVPEEIIKKIKAKMIELNNRIIKQLGQGFAIGHSFFSSLPEDKEYNQKWYDSVINTEIKPLLDEYWFDDDKKAKEEADLLAA